MKGLGSKKNCKKCGRIGRFALRFSELRGVSPPPVLQLALAQRENQADQSLPTVQALASLAADLEWVGPMPQRLAYMDKVAVRDARASGKARRRGLPRDERQPGLHRTLPPSLLTSMALTCRQELPATAGFAILWHAMSMTVELQWSFPERLVRRKSWLALRRPHRRVPPPSGRRARPRARQGGRTTTSTCSLKRPAKMPSAWQSLLEALGAAWVEPRGLVQPDPCGLLG